MAPVNIHAVALLACCCIMALSTVTSAFRTLSTSSQRSLTHRPGARVTRMASSSSTSAQPVTKSPPVLVPRGAVSIVTRCTVHEVPYYLLIQRRNPPNQGQWTFPGGKIEFGEATLDAARREWAEEIVWNDDTDNASLTTIPESPPLQWHDSAFCTSDSFEAHYHFLIAQCFANAGAFAHLPVVRPADDAKDARWFSLIDIDEACSQGHSPVGIGHVVYRAERYLAHGILPG
jgi:ADP-ribose pyrophosphatase YjhB (NUDIX family)